MLCFSLWLPEVGSMALRLKSSGDAKPARIPARVRVCQCRPYVAIESVHSSKVSRRFEQTSKVFPSQQSHRLVLLLIDKPRADDACRNPCGRRIARQSNGPSFGKKEGGEETNENWKTST
jgi:hypothetical protein